jgi:hypothetical protein
MRGKPAILKPAQRIAVQIARMPPEIAVRSVSSPPRTSRKSQNGNKADEDRHDPTSKD